MKPKLRREHGTWLCEMPYSLYGSKMIVIWSFGLTPIEAYNKWVGRMQSYQMHEMLAGTRTHFNFPRPAYPDVPRAPLNP